MGEQISLELYVWGNTRYGGTNILFQGPTDSEEDLFSQFSDGGLGDVYWGQPKQWVNIGLKYFFLSLFRICSGSQLLL